MEEEKSMQTPEEHRLEAELRVCDPDKVDHTQEIDTARIDVMARELYEGFETLRKYKLAATFFGSARCSVGDEIYTAATELAGKLAKSRFTIITGGAGGIMQAANQGAYEAGGQSVGLNIRLPEEQGENGFLTESKTFNYFFTRKVMLTFASEVYVYFPGGFGTMDEFFEILTLIQTGKIKRIPIILYDREYWQPLLHHIEHHIYEKYQAIDKEDMSLYTLVDSVDEAHEKILDLVKC